MSIHTILGAGGAIADSLSVELLSRRLPVRLVSRHPAPSANAEVLAADLTQRDEAIRAISGSSVVYLCVGLKYDYRIWRQQWPRIFDNTIEACIQSRARLIFFDNVYMYGRTDGPMTEETPYDPSSRKGDLRARLATQLMSEVRKGNIVATIARSADFYGPATTKTSVPDLLVFQRLLKGQKAQWLVNAAVPHSFTYVPDAARALAILAADDNSWNQVWHLPTAAPAITGAEFIRLAASILQKDPRYSILFPWMIRLGGLFDRTTSELREMLYQYAYDYRFDSSKFEKAYNFRPTPYEEGIRSTIDWHLGQQRAGSGHK
jgi:nucleoside-diphosphate-sugar epimerase